MLNAIKGEKAKLLKLLLSHKGVGECDSKALNVQRILRQRGTSPPELIFEIDARPSISNPTTRRPPCFCRRDSYNRVYSISPPSAQDASLVYQRPQKPSLDGDSMFRLLETNRLQLLHDRYDESSFEGNTSLPMAWSHYLIPCYNGQPQHMSNRATQHSLCRMHPPRTPRLPPSQSHLHHLPSPLSSPTAAANA